MARVNNRYYNSTTDNSTNGTFTGNNYYYPWIMRNNSIYLGMDSALTAAKPKIKTFQDELQVEVDDWLKIFN